MQQASVSLAILAGGRSRRLGQDKAFAAFGSGTLLEWLRDRVGELFPYTFIVAKDVARFRGLGLPVVADAVSSRGAAVGVYSAVLASPTPRTLCLACDIPFVTPELLQLLVERSEGYDAFVPRDGGGLQPLCAVYGKRAVDALEQMLIADERRLDILYERVKTGYLDVREHDLGDPSRLFLNVNTQAELAVARRTIGMAGGEALGTGRDRPSPLVAPTLAPHVEDFLARVARPTVSFVGKKKSGKTTALAGVIAELSRRGRRVAAVKHDAHGFSIDVPGTDTHRLRQAGAPVTLISSPDDVAIMSSVGEDLPLTGLVARIREPIDIVLTEGFMRGPAPKFEISRAERSDSLIAPPDELLGVMTDQPFPGHPAPLFALDDYVAVADVLDALIRRWRASRTPAVVGGDDAGGGVERDRGERRGRGDGSRAQPARAAGEQGRKRE